MKIVLNKCYGGFGLSSFAIYEIAKRKNIHLYTYIESKSQFGNSVYVKMFDEELLQNLRIHCFEKDYGEIINPIKSYIEEFKLYIDRDDPELIDVIKKYGYKTYGDCAELVIVEIPDGIDWKIEEYDGFETIHEKHLKW